MIAIGSALKLFFVDALRSFLALHWVHEILHSRSVRLFLNLIAKPIVPTLIAAWLIPADTLAWRKYAALVILYVGLAAFVNSRVGRTLEEMALDAVSEGWQRFGVRPILGLFWFIVDLFRRLLQGIERVLYTVDEWLRFRSGQGRATLIAKGALGVVWFFIAYVVRFCVNLLIEPQVNPLKHFPWVTASHKMMWPLFIASGLKEFLGARLGPAAGDTLFVVIGTAAPGIVGFLVWEFKENWRLFIANRSKNLQPVLIGSHGETMTRLLRPGIHSGTIPKRFAKLRRAERKALGGADPGAARKHREALHHVEIELRRYIEREFLAWFEEKGTWPVGNAKVGEIHLATSEAAVEVELPQPVEGPVTMKFRLVESAVEVDLSGRLCTEVWPTASREVFRLTLINVLKTASAETFARSDELSATEGAYQPLEVGSLVVTWADWVAAWEGEKDAGKAAAWDVIPLR
jgi:hypothetical protein